VDLAVDENLCLRVSSDDERRQNRDYEKPSYDSCAHAEGMCKPCATWRSLAICVPGCLPGAIDCQFRQRAAGSVTRSRASETS